MQSDIGGHSLDTVRTVPGVPKGMSADQIQRLLAVVPNSKTGLRDRAIILTLTFTGRRRAEVMGLNAGNSAPRRRSCPIHVPGQGWGDG